MIELKATKTKKYNELEDRIDSLCEELWSCCSELEDLCKSRVNKKGRPSEYSKWLFDYFYRSYPFVSDIHRNSTSLYSQMINGLVYLEEEDAVKTVEFSLEQWKPIIFYVPKDIFNFRSDDNYIMCPDCGLWVKKNSPSCVCGHRFQEEDVIVLKGVNGRIDRFSKSGNIIKQETFIKNDNLEKDLYFVTEFRFGYLEDTEVEVPKTEVLDHRCSDGGYIDRVLSIADNQSYGENKGNSLLGFNR